MPRRTSHTNQGSEPMASTSPTPSEPTRPRGRPGPKPGTEAARRGGLAAAAKYGPDYYRRIGSAGGKAVREKRGSDLYVAIGKKGGDATKRNKGLEHYTRIGHIGGSRRGQSAKNGQKVTANGHPEP